MHGPRSDRFAERYISDKITILCCERVFNQVYICFIQNVHLKSGPLTKP